MTGTSCRCRTVEGLCAQATMWDCCDSFGGGRRLLLGEPSANTPYPLARTFAPPPHFPPQHAGIPPSPNNHPPNHFFNHPTTTPTITQPRLNHPSCRIQERFRHNHPTSAILRIDNVELHGLGSSINCLGRRVTSYTTRDPKEIAKLLAMLP